MSAKTLKEHRECLSSNPNAYSEDLVRLERTLIPHLKRCGYSKIGKSSAKPMRELFVSLIFDTQDNLPFFHVDGDLPFCWNSPKGWQYNYIRYEWGHLDSKNQNNNAERIDNLSIMSARCNQHMQTSMDIDEVREWLYGSRLSSRIEYILAKRELLFRSKAWSELIESLEEFV